MITIKDTLGNVRFSTEINTGSRRKFSLMSEDYIVLKFSVEDPVYFKLGDYTDTELGLFELVDLYKPTLNDSTGAYDYELRLDAHYYKWKNKIFKFNPEVGGSEAGWKLTATLDVHLGVFLRNLSALGYTYKGTPFEVNIDSTVAKTSKLIVYDNTNLIDALTQMAETWECEWWVEDNQIRFGRCEFGDPVDFVINENVERMPREESKATFATRVYAFGSTRNIPNDYRPVDESVVVNGIVQKRLMMPTGVPYVDAYLDMTTEEAVEDVVIFDYIYPRRTGTMSSVTPVERTGNVENEGSTTQQKYTVYQFKDTGITFSKDYILPGEELRIVFQTGVMAGMDFAVTFNPDNLPEKLEDGSWNPQAQLWEIVRNEDYGRMLPADTLIPSNGDTYNLYGFDSTSPVFVDMIKRAEEELEEKARDYVEKTKIDPNTYPCTMMSDYMYNDGNVRTNEFTVGARINLINPAYFENGRVSRVIGFEFDLDIPYSSPTFTIGETASYSRIGEIEDKVDELTYKGQVFTGTGSGVYVIGTNDNTPPTNKNVYSALKILREFVRYQGWVDQPVRTTDPVKFNSVTSTDFESKLKGWIIDALGNTEFRDVLLRSFKSWNFAAGPLGAGVGMVNDDELQTDKLLVRKIMYVLEMMIQRMRFQGGIMVLSPATGFKIDRVETFDTYYRVYCRPEDFNEFEVNDQARIQNFTGNNIKYLWSLVLSRGDDYIDISRVDKDGEGVPAEGDEIVQLGNRTNPDRQDAVLLSAVNGEVGIFTYYGINSFDLSSKEGSWLGKHGGKKGAVIRGEVHITSNSSGLDNFSEFEGVSQDIQDAQSSANEADRKAQEIQNYIDNTLRTELDGLHDQADGLVERWPGNYIPLPNNENPTAEANYPADQWTTEAEKQKHIDDTFTKDSGSSEYLGNSWKWSKVNGVWQWVLISDTALTAALAQSARAEETAKRKTRNFIVTPYPPYEAGDTWSQGATGDYMRCVQDRLSGSFVSSDWEKASKYTDDTKANEALQRMKDMADDNIITKEEKATLRNDLKQIEESVNNYQAQATKYGVSITALQNTYNTLKTFLTDIVKVDQNIDTYLTVAQQTTYNQNFANYYSEVTAFSSLISQKINDESVGNLQIGMVNLLKGSNVELGAQKYDIGRYYFDKKPEVGKTYTLVVCYTIGVNNTHIGAYQDYGANLISNFTTKGNKVVETRTFKYSSTRSEEFMTFYQFPNGTYGSKVHWAVLVEGNKGPSAWVPALSEQGEEAAKDAVDNLQIGSVNLVSRKMMLAWNEKNKDIAVWGQDSDGIYLSINPRLLYENIGGSASYNDIFENKIKYKSNTQYVFSIEWKAFVVQTTTYDGLSLTVHYTDGTKESLFDTTRTQSTNTRTDFITQKGKTIQKISCTYGTLYVRTLVYSLALYEGNKVLSEPPVATEDLTGQSNVNLVDGGKEVTVTVTVGDNYAARLLVVPVLKPNTVYHVSFKAKNLAGSPPYYTAALYDKNISVKYFRLDSVSGGIMITPNNFTEGEATLLLYAGVSGSTAGNSVKFSEVMLVEGFTPPSSYSPSPGDVAKDIKDVSDAVTNLDTTINTTFKDGIISEAEAKAIASNINVLNAEKADIDAYYTKLYANAYLTGTAKTNLASAKTAYNTAHTNLINSINTAIADGKTTATEKADVDAKFSAYNNALSAYQTRVGEADKAIQDTIKKVADDAQTSANTAQSAANAAQSAANQAQADANAANSKLTTWASDNYISPQEKTALRQQKSDIQSEQKDIEANANRYGISLASYMAAYNAAIAALNKYTATSPENIQVIQSEYDNIAAYYPARQTILNSIAAAAKAQADKATGAIGMDGGKMLYADPEFKKGLNGMYKYTNSSNVDPDYIASKLTVERVTKPSDAPTQSGYCLKITCKAAQSPGYGGVYQSITSRANAVFVQKIIAKIPVGYQINTASNSMGTGYTDTWLTPTKGTGKYTTYLRKVVCGTTGNFSTGGYVYINGSPAPTESAPLEWYIAYMTAFDLTADGYGDIEYNAKDDLAQQLGYSNFDKMVENASKEETIIKGAYINTKLIDVETLVADTALVDKLIGRELNFTLGSVGGFKMESTLLYSGAKFGTGGAGIAMQSMTNNYGFNVYKDNNNYVEMFQRSSEWGLKGVVNGSPVFQFGSTNKIGPFDYDKSDLISNVGDNKMTLNAQYVKFEYMRGTTNSHYAYLGTPGNAGYGSNTLLVVEGGDIYHQGYIYSENRVGRFYSSDIHMRGEMKMYDNATITDYNGNFLIKNGCFGWPIRSLNIYGTSTTIASNYMIGLINLIASSGVNVTLKPGFPGQILVLLNYTTNNMRIVRNDNGALVTILKGQKSGIFYFEGNSWLAISITDYYNT